MQFRTKARAVDLLGKGQISDLPTAISELWKNGYDAYGDKLEAFLYLKGYQNLQDTLFVLSDDGIGMSMQDITDKWIVLGTDSKSRNKTDQIGDDTLGKPPRIKMGEKGIGRLSVAYLGSPMIMLTKKRNEPLQALFFDWRILENYNYFLEDINIPVRTVFNTNQFDAIYEELKDELLQNFNENSRGQSFWADQEDLKNEIVKDIESASLPSFFQDEIINVFCRIEDHGTRFVIFNPDEQLTELGKYAAASNRPDFISSSLNDIRKTLNGLFNVFKDAKEKSPIKTSFLIHNEDGPFDFISSRDFFEPLDFENCDHLIDGEFDSTGFFKGKVRVFKQTVDFTFRNTKPQGNVPYGPFKIKVGAVPGRYQPTIMNDEQFSKLSQKLDEFGGLYIYRDNFRVLPYGKTEVDFLNFEKRRSYHAGDFFFSHRRMFGYIDITRAQNIKLKDKAGREGFIVNQAYREFKADLEAFFIALASQFFGTNAKSDLKETQLQEMANQKAIVQKEIEREKEERSLFSKQLNERPIQLKGVEEEFAILSEKLKNAISKNNDGYGEIKALLTQVENYKVKANSLHLKKPLRFQLTEIQEKKLFNYTNNLDLFFKQTYASNQDLINSARERLREQDLLNEYNGLCEYYKNVINSKFHQYGIELKKGTDTLLSRLKAEQTSSLEEMNVCINNYHPKAIERETINHSINLLGSSFEKIQNDIESKIPPFIKHLERLSFDVDEDILTGYYKIRFEEIEKQWQQTKEMAQLGVAVEIIDHQFNALYSRLANTINNLPQYIKDENKAKQSYNDLKTAFQHLEGKYKLLSPLYRTTGKLKKTISGKTITEYMTNFFSGPFRDNNITIEATDAFVQYEIYTFESILIPVFINIINNAIYWLIPVNERKIVLDVMEDKLLIMNSGVKIEDYYLSKIFELFYSKRPDGRGIGLYLAKENLNAIDLDVLATNDTNYNRINGACFIIQPLNKRENE